MSGHQPLQLMTDLLLQLSQAYEPALNSLYATPDSDNRKAGHLS